MLLQGWTPTQALPLAPPLPAPYPLSCPISSSSQPWAKLRCPIPPPDTLAFPSLQLLQGAPEAGLQALPAGPLPLWVPAHCLRQEPGGLDQTFGGSGQRSLRGLHWQPLVNRAEAGTVPCPQPRGSLPPCPCPCRISFWGLAAALNPSNFHCPVLALPRHNHIG